MELTLPAPATPERAIVTAGLLSEGTYVVGADRMRVRVTTELGPGEGAALAREERALLDGLFEDHQAPYPGALSNTLRCADELRPADVEPRGDALYLVQLYANDRYAFGGCAEDLLRYRATAGAWFDEGRAELIRVEYFEPKEGSTNRGPDVLRSLRWVGR